MRTPLWHQSVWLYLHREDRRSPTSNQAWTILEEYSFQPSEENKNYYLFAWRGPPCRSLLLGLGIYSQQNRQKKLSKQKHFFIRKVAG
ncbi:MAG: hypothetical protein AB4040_10630 [Synechococcus sp.]